ncbi:MAG: hypothetical protein FWE99_01865 [Bacteroidales bacterium]|nr:hypothetical protein [Bacteroidales bacterium]
MKHRLLFCLIPLWPIALSGQNAADYNLFMDAAVIHSAVFKGAFPTRFGFRTSHDGSTFFAYSANFESGTLVFRGKPYTNMLLNLNAQMDELYVQEPTHGIPVVVNKHFVDSFTMGKRRFIRHEPEGNSPLKEGYYEVVYSGGCILLKKIQKQLKEDTGSGNRVTRRYILLETFYVQKNDRWHRVNNKADMTRLFPEQRKTINRTVRTKALDFRNNKEISFIEMLTHMDSL